MRARGFPCFAFSKSKSQNGFAIAEIVIAIVFVTLAISLVAGLGQQVMNLAKSSRQTGAVIELRSKTNSMTRNVDSWLGKMRSSVHTNGLYAACIPDPSSVSSIHKCPAVDSTLLSSDAELAKIAGTQLHPSSSVIVDLMGDILAGPANAPAYFDLNGRPCENSSNSCALKSTGYVLRSNPDTNSNPGSVRFVVKIEANSNVSAKGTTPIRTQYLSIDIGNEWQQPAGFCPSGSLKVGYLSNGKPNCINPLKPCASGTIHLGLDTNGNTICKTPPASCATTGGSVVIDAAGTDLVCSSSSPCEANQIFLGYYSGTGTPMCSSTSLNCPAGEVQIGISQVGANLQAACKKLPSCNDAQKLSYDGSQFVCQSASVASNCLEGEVVVGINSDGSAKCEAQERNLASTDLTCPSGKYVSGLKADGSVICETLPSGGNGNGSGSSTNTGSTATASPLYGYVTNEIDIPTNSGHVVVSAAHNLGQVPTIVKWVLVCKTAQRGFEVGDEVDVATLSNPGGQEYHARTYFQNATRVSIAWYDPRNYFIRGIAKVLNDSMGDSFQSPAWKLKAYVYSSALAVIPTPVPVAAPPPRAAPTYENIGAQCTHAEAMARTGCYAYCSNGGTVVPGSLGGSGLASNAVSVIGGGGGIHCAAYPVGRGPTFRPSCTAVCIKN